jgi:hypothetical protein
MIKSENTTERIERDPDAPEPTAEGDLLMA